MRQLVSYAKSLALELQVMSCSDSLSDNSLQDILIDRHSDREVSNSYVEYRSGLSASDISLLRLHPFSMSLLRNCVPMAIQLCLLFTFL